MFTTCQENDQKVVRIYETGFVPDVKETEMSVVNLYPQVTYQTWEGFGGALTESSAYTMSKMNPEDYQKIVDAYYGPNGIGYNMGRLHLDSCDFSLDNYCAIEDAEDKSFQSFSMERDEKYVQPLVKSVMAACNENVILLLSPWTPPAFMKDTKVRNGGGRLLKESYEEYANYFCRYIKEYQKRGININCLTIQNEPLAVQTWDSCQYSGEEEKDFLKNYLYPEMQEQGLGHVGIYIWDHNKERVFERAEEILDDETMKMVEGIAFHWYSGDHFETLEMVQKMFPGKKLMHSEGCVEYSRYGAGNELEHAEKYAHDIIGDMNAGTNSFIDWNIVLDEKGGPNHVFNYCGAPIMCDTKNKTFECKLTYDYIGHFSKYIRPNAKRIGFSKFTDKLEMTAFQNTDGTVVAVLLNRTKENIRASVRIKKEVTRITIAPNSINTLIVTDID
jgi:glucosylceramidase